MTGQYSRPSYDCIGLVFVFGPNVLFLRPGVLVLVLKATVLILDILVPSLKMRSFVLETCCCCLHMIHSGRRGCVLHMLGAVPRSATDDHLHPQPPVDCHTARDSESSLLRLRYRPNNNYTVS